MQGSKDLDERNAARTKLDDLQAVYQDTRPTALRNAKYEVKLPTLVVDQFYNLGLINEKRRDAVKARMGRVRRR